MEKEQRSGTWKRSVARGLRCDCAKSDRRSWRSWAERRTNSCLRRPSLQLICLLWYGGSDEIHGRSYGMRSKPASRQPGIADGFPGERLTILPPAVLRRAKTLPGCRGLAVTHIGRFDHVRGHSVERPGGTRESLFILCLNGAGRGHLDGVSWSLRSGQGVVLPPGLPHGYAADPKNPWTLIWVHFVGPWAVDFTKIIGGTGPHH
jgi:hypothetical protein